MYCIVKFWKMELELEVVHLYLYFRVQMNQIFKISMCLWWQAMREAVPQGNMVARACQQARAARAISLQGL